MYGQQMVGSFAIIFVHELYIPAYETHETRLQPARIIFNDKNAHIRNSFRLA